MKRSSNKSVTLIELLVAVTLIVLVILATANIDLFSRGYLLNADRKAKLQNELYLVADDICKNVAQAPGDFNNKAVTVGGTNVTVRNESAFISYNFTNNKIQKNYADLSIHRVIANFTPSTLDNGIGVELNITGRYDPSQNAAINNPEVNITTRCYSHQASAR
jgi:Tfp pilus assembly protein PilW